MTTLDPSFDGLLIARKHSKVVHLKSKTDSLTFDCYCTTAASKDDKDGYKLEIFYWLHPKESSLASKSKSEALNSAIQQRYHVQVRPNISFELGTYSLGEMFKSIENSMIQYENGIERILTDIIREEPFRGWKLSTSNVEYHLDMRSIPSYTTTPSTGSQKCVSGQLGSSSVL